MDNLSIYCVDVGSIAKGEFAWASAGGGKRPDRDTCKDIGVLAAAVNDDLAASKPVALGFECPLFVPVHQLPEALNTARSETEWPAWSSGPGASVLATGIPQVVWLLNEVARAQRPQPDVFLDWKFFHNNGSGLLLWEAFVTGKSKAQASGEENENFLDAQIAAKALEDRLPYPEADVSTDRPFSLAGAALLWSGLSDDLELLHTQTLVIKPGAA